MKSRPTRSSVSVDYNKVLIRRGKLVYKGRVLGPVDKVYAFPGEQAHLGRGAEIVVCSTPERIDLLFTAGLRVVGCEVKTGEDLINSYGTRRLHRQLSTLRRTVDVSCLIIRYAFHDLDALVGQLRRPHEFWEDWVNWQTNGVYILHVPLDNYLDRLLLYRKALCTTGERVFKGTDLRAPRERRAGWLLRRIPGLGPKKSAEAIAAFGSTMKTFEAAVRGDAARVLGKSLENKICKALEA